MTINKNRDVEKLLLHVEGRLDTTTAPQLEEALGDNLIGVKSLILDFTELEYISSAGLRVLLAALKTMLKQKGSMVVRGANEGVREIFTITGFSETLDIE